jgi:hypothetical protein
MINFLNEFFEFYLLFSMFVPYLMVFISGLALFSVYGVNQDSNLTSLGRFCCLVLGVVIIVLWWYYLSDYAKFTAEFLYQFNK